LLDITRWTALTCRKRFTEPHGLSVEAIMHGDYPDDWPGQRAALGFPAVA